MLCLKLRTKQGGAYLDYLECLEKLEVIWDVSLTSVLFI